MAVQATPLSVALLVSGLLTSVVAVFVWQERPKSGATWLTAEVVLVAAWALGQALVVAGTDAATVSVGYDLSLVSFAFVTPVWLVFVLLYTGRSRYVTPVTLAVLAVEPLAVVGLGLTNGGHGLVYASPVTAGTEMVDWGVLVLAHFALGYAGHSLAEWFLFEKFLGSRNVYRKRTFWLLFASLVLLVSHAVSTARLSPLPHYTLGPLAFLVAAVGSLLVFLGYRSYEFLPLRRLLSMFGSRSRRLAPVARDKAIENVEIGFLVLDHANRVVDANPTGKQILTGDDGRIVGKELTRFVPPENVVGTEPSFLDPDAPAGEYTGVWIETDDGRRCYDVLVTRLAEDEDRRAGRLLLVHDVTERERNKEKLEERTEQLERQNEQLERFAGIVSHDLRNPLTVAESRLELLEVRVDEEQKSIAEAQAALDRMEDIISDVLALARLGQSIDETEPVDLGEVGRTAWANVDAPAAELDCALGLTTTGDRSRLCQLFENLFRNAIEHGREDVTITVGELPNGFYVADDGPGIPPEHREAVFDEGFTTAEDGTGFGLAIIDTIVEAHGWSVAVTETEDGGARFEITGVSPPREEVTRSAT